MNFFFLRILGYNILNPLRIVLTMIADLLMFCLVVKTESAVHWVALVFQKSSLGFPPPEQGFCKCVPVQNMFLRTKKGRRRGKGEKHKPKEKSEIKRMRRSAKHQEKIFAKDIFNKEFVSKIYQELLKLNNRKAHDPIKNWAISIDTTKKDSQSRWQISI